jgi:hypothetical protein
MLQQYKQVETKISGFKDDLYQKTRDWVNVGQTTMLNSMDDKN